MTHSKQYVLLLTQSALITGVKNDANEKNSLRLVKQLWFSDNIIMPLSIRVTVEILCFTISCVLFIARSYISIMTQ